MSVYNENNKFKKKSLYKRKKDLYISRRITLDPIELSTIVTLSQFLYILRIILLKNISFFKITSKRTIISY